MDPFYVVLEMTYVFQDQRSILTLWMIAGYLCCCVQLMSMLSVEMVVHYGRSAVSKRPLSNRLTLVPNTAWALCSLH